MVMVRAEVIGQPARVGDSGSTEGPRGVDLSLRSEAVTGGRFTVCQRIIQSLSGQGLF